MVALNTPMKQSRLDGKQRYHWLIFDTRFWILDVSLTTPPMISRLSSIEHPASAR
jgi:hypothetical protein